MRLLTSLFALLALTSTLTAAQSPNFILIFTDDQGYQDIGVFGAPKIKTPHLDKMAAQGMKFTDFYVGAPICSASRAALLTGSYCDRTGVKGVFFPNRNYQGLNPDEITIAEVLKAKGYATACIGKWHLGDDLPFLPTKQGFDLYYGVPYSNDMSVNPNMKVAKDCTFLEGMTAEKMRTERPKKNWVPLMRNEEVIEYPTDQRLLTKRYTEQTIDFIKTNKDKPFFVYLPHTMPHIPLFSSEQFDGKSAGGPYGDTIEEIDWSVGQILKTLQELNLDKNTLVVYTSDNGPWLSKGKAGGSAKPLRDGKFTTYEGGMREPCIMRWPGHIPAGETCDKIASTIDLLPTFASLAGAKLNADRKIDGLNIIELLEGKKDANPRPHFFYRTNAVREGKWKYMAKGGRVKETALYDLSTDISESKNLISEHPEIADKLAKMLADHKTDLQANSRPVGKFTPGSDYIKVQRSKKKKKPQKKK